MANPALQAAYNPSTSTLTVTLNNPPVSGAPTSVNVFLCGQSISVPLTNNTGTLPLSVHPSIAGCNITAQVSVPSAEQTTPPIGTVLAQLGTSGGPAASIQLGLPAASGDPYAVWPTSKSLLRAYYSGLLGSQAAAMAAQTAQAQDLYTVASILAHALTAHLLPQATAATWAPITLSADEQNALADLQANVQPHMSQSMETIYPSGGSRTEAYQGVVTRAPAYDTALTGYAAAVAAATAAGLPLSD